MKLLTVIGIFLLTTGFAHSQVSFQVFTQSGEMSRQTGATLGWNNARGLGVGITYQASKSFSLEYDADNYPFYGLTFQVPLKNCGDLSFLLTPKAGFVNQYFFIVIPEVTTEIKFSNHIAGSIATGIRARKPSLSLGIRAYL